MALYNRGKPGAARNAFMEARDDKRSARIAWPVVGKHDYSQGLISSCIRVTECSRDGTAPSNRYASQYVSERNPIELK